MVVQEALGLTMKIVKARNGGVKTRRSSSSFLLGVCERLERERYSSRVQVQVKRAHYQLLLRDALLIQERVPVVEDRSSDG